MNGRTVVSIVRVRNSINEGVRKALDLIGDIPYPIHSETKVLIKPNIMRAEPSIIGTTTNIEVIRAVADIFQEKGAKVIVGEASGNQYNTEDIYSFLKIREQLRDFEVLDLDQDNIIQVEIKDAKALKKIGIAETALKADLIISLPIMKTHNLSLVTGGMKNMMGVLPQMEKWNMHLSGIHQAIVDLNRIVKPHLIVMDAIACMEGYGPAMGYPVEMNLVLAGTDVVAVDTVAARIMKIDLNHVKHLVVAGNQGLGISDLAEIEIKGENLDDVKRNFRKPKGLKLFEFYGKIQYRVGRFILNHFNYDLRSIIRSLSLFHLPKPKLDYTKCKEIGDCLSVCPESAISMSKFPFINYSKCTRCMLCYEKCSNNTVLISRLPIWALRFRNLYFSIISKN